MNNIFIGISDWFGSLTLDDVKTLTDIFQNLALFIGALVAAWWAYVTFGLKDKRDELSTIAKKIHEIHSHIDHSVLSYDFQKVLVSVAGADEQKLIDFNRNAKARLTVLYEELSNLRDLSFNISQSFRILTISEYQIILLDLQMRNIDYWSDQETKSKLITAKAEILHKIYGEMNLHKSFPSWVDTKIRNIIYYVKHLFSTF